MEKRVTAEEMAAFSPIRVTSIARFGIDPDIDAVSVWMAFGRVGLKEGDVAVLLVGHRYRANLMEIRKGLPENVGIAMTIVAGAYLEWMLVAPNGLAIFSAPV